MRVNVDLSSVTVAEGQELIETNQTLECAWFSKKEDQQPGKITGGKHWSGKWIFRNPRQTAGHCVLLPRSKAAHRAVRKGLIIVWQRLGLCEESAGILYDMGMRISTNMIERLLTVMQCQQAMHALLTFPIMPDEEEFSKGNKKAIGKFEGAANAWLDKYRGKVPVLDSACKGLTFDKLARLSDMLDHVMPVLLTRIAA